MKVAICFLVVAAATAYAEYCDHTHDCTLVACNSGFTLSCYHDNVCTCLPHTSTFSCTLPPQCAHAFGSCTHGDHQWHCIDNRCQCRSTHD